ALKANNFVKAETIQSEMESALKPSGPLPTCMRKPGPDNHTNLIGSQAFESAELQLNTDKMKDLLDAPALTTDSAGSPSHTIQSNKYGSESRRTLLEDRSTIMQFTKP